MLLLQVKILLDKGRDSSLDSLFILLFFFLFLLFLLFPLFRAFIFLKYHFLLFIMLIDNCRLRLFHLRRFFLLLLCTLLDIVVFLQYISKQRGGKVLFVGILSGATHNRCHCDGLTLLGCNFLPSIVAAHRHSPDLARNTATRWMRFKSTSCSLPPKMSTFRSGFASAIA